MPPSMASSSDHGITSADNVTDIMRRALCKVTYRMGQRLSQTRRIDTIVICDLYLLKTPEFFTFQKSVEFFFKSV